MMYTESKKPFSTSGLYFTGRDYIEVKGKKIVNGKLANYKWAFKGVADKYYDLNS